MAISLILDVVVAILLVVTIGYAVTLNRRLDSLRRNKSELEKLASVFSEATMRAGDSIFKLKGMADELHDRMDKAVALRDDLVFLIERGGSSADRLEEAVRAARQEEPLPAEDASGEDDRPAASKPQSGEAKKQAARSKAEQELLKALQSAR